MAAQPAEASHQGGELDIKLISLKNDLEQSSWGEKKNAECPEISVLQRTKPQVLHRLCQSTVGCVVFLHTDIIDPAPRGPCWPELEIHLSLPSKT